MMKYVSLLLENKEYIRTLRKISAYERERIYCKHDFAHLMDVARLMWQRALEDNLRLDKEMVYLAALLHDVGRIKEYEEGISHDAAGRELAGEILLHIGYPTEKTPDILEAIGMHREKENVSASPLCGLLKEADKMSRPCFFCEAADSCKWSEGKKNKTENWR